MSELALHQQRITILFLGVAHALDHSFLVALPPVLLLITGDLGVSLAEVGLAATVAYLLFGAGALIGGPLSDRIGEGKVVFASLVLAGVSTLILLVDRSYLSFVAMLALTATWTSFYHPTANSLISKRYPQEMGRAMAIHGICGSVGQVFVPSIAVYLALAAGWRFSFMFFGALSIIVSVYFFRLRRVERTEERKKSRKLVMLKNRRFWALLVCNIMIGLYYRGAELFLPAYLTRLRGLSIEASGLAVSLLMAFGVLGQFLGGVGGDRIGNVRALVLESVAVAVGFIFLQLEGLAASAAFIVLFGVAFYATQPTTNALTAEITRPEERGFAYGVMFFTVFGLGSVSSTIAGEIAEVSGLQSAFSALSVFSVLALVSSLLLSKAWAASTGPSTRGSAVHAIELMRAPALQGWKLGLKKAFIEQLRFVETRLK
jgi:MFS family permease